MYISPKLTDVEYAEGRVNELLKCNSNVTYSEDLHLSVSLRSYRAEKLSAFVHALLSFDESAGTLYNEIKDKYPIVLTRDMAKARKWLRSKVRGTERTGVLVTKESARFKPLAVHVLPSGDEFMNVIHEYPDITVHLTLFNATIKAGVPALLEHNDLKWITPSEIEKYEFCPADKEILAGIIRKNKE